MPEELGSVERILIAGLCGVGDLLFFLPSLKALRSSFKDSRIDLLVLPNGSKGLFEGRGLVDSVYEFPRLKWASDQKGLKGQVDVVRAVANIRKRGYDLCIWPYAATTLKKQFLTMLLGAGLNVMHKGERFLAGRAVSSRNHLVGYPAASHGVERNIELLKAIGIEPSDREVVFPLSDKEVDFGKAYVKRLLEENHRSSAPKMLVGFHPGGNLAYNSQRQWPPRGYARLADMISGDFGSLSFFFGLNNEKEILEEITGSMKTGFEVVTGLDLKAVASIMKNMDLFIGNNSALIHLAAALGVKTVDITGPTDYHHTGPWGRQTFVVRLDLDCSPCYSYNAGQSKPCSDNICLAEFEPDDVYSYIRNLVGTMGSEKDDFLPVVYNVLPKRKGRMTHTSGS